MTTVTLYKHDGKLIGFEASGHAGYAEEGSDIVCAAISVLTQAAVIGMMEVLHLPVKLERDDGAGFLKAILPVENAPEAQVLLETMRLSLKSIRAEYPSFLKLITREWRV
ncbi:MAG: ribosomal-processing cysteine protease Prp [Clostridiales bacterium]|nr:ribosomal-processing cysteine protease Prp [Clostridiales bacterium]